MRAIRYQFWNYKKTFLVEYYIFKSFKVARRLCNTRAKIVFHASVEVYCF